MAEAVGRTGDPYLASIAQLFTHLTGDSPVPLDRVIGLPDDAAPAECVVALQAQVDEVARRGRLPPELEHHLATAVATIG